MMTCPDCGGPTIELFLSRKCKAECDLRQYTVYKSQSQDPENVLLSFRSLVQDLLANPPPGLGYLRFSAVTYGNQNPKSGVFWVYFDGPKNNTGLMVVPFERIADRSHLESQMISLAQKLA